MTRCDPVPRPRFPPACRTSSPVHEIVGAVALVIKLPSGGEDRYKYMRGDTARVIYRAEPNSDGGLEIIESHMHLVGATGEWIRQFDRSVAYYDPSEWESFVAAPIE